MKYLIWTILTNNYDTLHDAPSWHEFDFICFTDNNKLSVKGWHIVYLPELVGSVKNQRRLKILRNETIKEYKASIYIDASYEVINNPFKLIREYFKGGICAPKHPDRNCFLDEYKRVIELKKDTQQNCVSQIQKYLGFGMPLNYGLIASGILIRDNSICDFEQTWFDEVSNNSHRDQLSVMYAAWHNNIKINTIPQAEIQHYFKNYRHNKIQNFNIYYSNPFSIEKNIGKAYNDFISKLNCSDEDYIVIQDGDIIYLTHDWGKKIYDSLFAEGNNFAIIGCYTNRLRSKTQLDKQTFCEISDIKYHYEVAKNYDEIGINELKAPHIAGLFMCFKKKTWKLLGGFKENSIYFDTEFCQVARDKGLRIGLLKNLYVFHFYRFWSKTPFSDKKHLL